MKNTEERKSLIHGWNRKWFACLLMGCLFILPGTGLSAAPQSISSDEVIQAVDKVSPEIEKVANQLWEISEVSLLEVKSSDYLKEEIGRASCRERV